MNATLAQEMAELIRSIAGAARPEEVNVGEIWLAAREINRKRIAAAKQEAK